MLERVYYIDTRPGAPGPFVAPEEVLDYAAWLRDRYRAARMNEGGKEMFFGVAQRINQLIIWAKQGAMIHVIGPHATAAAQVIEELSGGLVQGAVLP